MDLVTILAAAAEESHDETAFLVVGAILAAFAVIAGALGIVRHQMSEGVARAIMAIGALLVAGTLVTVVAS